MRDWCANFRRPPRRTAIGLDTFDPLLDLESRQGPSRRAPARPSGGWGSGFLLDSSFARLLGPGSFANHGAGAQLAFGDGEFGVRFAYAADQRMDVAGGQARPSLP